jgi:hypothetical protein
MHLSRAGLGGLDSTLALEGLRRALDARMRDLESIAPLSAIEQDRDLRRTSPQSIQSRPGEGAGTSAGAKGRRRLGPPETRKALRSEGLFFVRTSPALDTRPGNRENLDSSKPLQRIDLGSHSAPTAKSPRAVLEPQKGPGRQRRSKDPSAPGS